MQKPQMRLREWLTDSEAGTKLLKEFDRRFEEKICSCQKKDLLTNGEFSINLASSEFFIAGRKTDITLKNYKLLAYFIENAGRALEFREVLLNVWGPAYVEDKQTLRVFVGALRKILDDRHHRIINAIPGVGYRMNILGEYS